MGEISRDRNTSVQELKNLIGDFVEERRWRQFHTPKNLAMSVAIEAAELMELFQWENEVELGPELLARVEEELADVFIYCLSLANAAGIDLSRAVRQKVLLNAKKYPVERFLGKYR